MPHTQLHVGRKRRKPTHSTPISPGLFSHSWRLQQCLNSKRAKHKDWFAVPIAMHLCKHLRLGIMLCPICSLLLQQGSTAACLLLPLTRANIQCFSLRHTLCSFIAEQLLDFLDEIATLIYAACLHANHKCGGCNCQGSVKRMPACKSQAASRRSSLQSNNCNGPGVLHACWMLHQGCNPLQLTPPAGERYW